MEQLKKDCFLLYSYCLLFSQMQMQRKCCVFPVYFCVSHAENLVTIVEVFREICHSSANSNYLSHTTGGIRRGVVVVSILSPPVEVTFGENFHICTSGPICYYQPAVKEMARFYCFIAFKEPLFVVMALCVGSFRGLTMGL